MNLTNITVKVAVALFPVFPVPREDSLNGHLLEHEPFVSFTWAFPVTSCYDRRDSFPNLD